MRYDLYKLVDSNVLATSTTTVVDVPSSFFIEDATRDVFDQCILIKYNSRWHTFCEPDDIRATDNCVRFIYSDGEVIFEQVAAILD